MKAPQDARGITPRKITRPSDSAVMWKCHSYSFGQALPNENPSDLGTFNYNLRFAGEYYDAESGLRHNYFSLTPG
jgi:hypothetical protein